MRSSENLKGRLLRNLTNAVGWRSLRKLVVFESDDWGAIRTPDRDTYNRLLRAGIRVDLSAYDRLDCLENREDFQALMNVISDHRDASGRPAVFTFNTVLGNPDFEAIRRDEFNSFHHQDLFKSYRYYHDEDLEPDWRKAIEEGLIRPQFHGREHLNVPLWMFDLRMGHTATTAAFNLQFYGLTTATSSARQKNYLAAFWAESVAQLQSAKERLTIGMELFKDTFGYLSTTFTPCNFVLPAELLSILSADGVGLIQGQRGQFVPDPMGGHGYIRRAFTGQKSNFGPLYSVRNVMFEPFESARADWVDRAMREISGAFRFGKPAIVSSHRVNYAGGMSQQHRNRSLRLLNQLLAEIRGRWPDVEFITSDELLTAMESP